VNILYNTNYNNSKLKKIEVNYFLKLDICYLNILIRNIETYERCLRDLMEYAIKYSGFPIVLEGYNDARSTMKYEFVALEMYFPLVVMYLHLVVVWLHVNQSDKQWLLDQQWNTSLLLLRWLIVKLSSW